MQARLRTPRRAYWATDTLTVAGTVIPRRVTDALIERMRAAPFTNGDLCTVAIAELRAAGGPVTAYFTLADRMIQKLKIDGAIVRDGEDRRAGWRWADRPVSAPATCRASA